VTAVLREFDTGHRAYATGARASGSSELDRIQMEWPTWCQRMGLARQVTPTEFEVPPLLGFRRIGAMEVWQIGLPGRFGDPGERSPRSMLPGFLQSSRRGAAAAHGFEVRPGVLEVVVSRSQLPDVLGFDPARIPTALHRVWLGQSIDGSDILWDLQVEPHGLVAGQTGSGKSKTVESVLTQFAVKGWDLIIVTPKLNDPILSGFAHGPHTVITGIGDDALELVAEMFRSQRAERTERQKIQAEHGVEWWHQVPPDVLTERPLTVLLMDESRSFLIQHRGESDHRRTLKAEILHAWNEWVQEGRSAGHHGLIVSQSIAVEGLGGGFVDDQLGMRLAVRRLSRKWHPVMFPETDSDAPSLLVNPATPPGRAVARGLVAPDTIFGSDAVNDAPMQVPLLDAAIRDGLLSGEIPWGPNAAAQPNTPGDYAPVPATELDQPRSGWALPLTVALVWLVVVLVLVVSLILEVLS
jgi:hypothetical protein